MGIFKEVQYVNLVAAVLNIILSIILGYAIGVAGVIVATAVSRLLTSFWYEGKVVLNKLEKSAKEYYLIQLRSVLIAAIIVGCSVGINHFVPIGGIVGMAIKIIVCTVITMLAEVLFNRKTLEVKMLTGRIMRMEKK